MELEDSVSYDLLFRDYNFENTEPVLPLVKKCLAVPSNETEFVRALEIALCFCLKNYPPNDLEDELLRMACPAAKNFVLDKIQKLEKNPAMCFEYLGVVLKIISYFQGVFEYLSETGKRTLMEAKSLLIATCEILHGCYCHCKLSEEVYGDHFNSATDCLSNFFKNCCSLQEQLLEFMIEKSECDTEDDRELLLLDNVLSYLSKSGVVLIHLEVKTMAKVWKTFAGLIQRYISFLRGNHSIDETVKELSHAITSNLESALNKDSEDISKVVKLSCFHLKLIIKFCELFKGCLKDSQKAILSLLLLLCRCDGPRVGEAKTKEKVNEEVLNQLAVGIDPLMSQMIEDELLVKECDQLGKNLERVPEFSILCCLILKKLIDSNKTTRNLWFNEKENILEWIFHSASSSQFVISPSVPLPTILVNGKQKKLTDLYEHVFVSSSAFLMTATAAEYRLVEKTLIRNVLQKDPMRALLAIDIWCLLARWGAQQHPPNGMTLPVVNVSFERFAGSELCFSQMFALGKLFQELHPGTQRPEKCYLRSLIRRLFPLLAERHRVAFHEAFPPSFLSAVWLGREMNALTASEADDVCRSLLAEVDHLVVENESSGFETERAGRREGALYERFGKKTARLWRFDCRLLSSAAGQSARFLKIMSALTARVVPEMPSEELLLVLSQIKKLISIGQPTAITLLFTWILTALSGVSVPPGKHRQSIITAIADIFRSLLSSKEAPVKQKALETFFFFSHITSHEEIISLSVQNTPELKFEVANYFRGKPVDQADFRLDEYLLELCRMRFEHVCQEQQQEAEEESGGAKRMRMWTGDAEEVVARWREDAEKILECFQTLSESDRRKIKNVCSSILSLP